LIEQANKFLRDPSIRDASSEEKLAFLESKGVLRADIERALGLIKSEIKDSQLPIPHQPTGPASSTPAINREAPVSSSPPPASPPTPTEASTVPPIITYPEFLIHSQKPPPLITISRLRNTAYLGGSIAALIYGASTYLLTPMSDALTAARHEFATHTAAHLDELNRRLGEHVSADPGPRGDDAPPTTSRRDSDAASDDSDPTELFHRDFGVQTSPKLRAADDGDEAANPAAPTAAGGGDDHDDDDDALEDATAAQSARLARLTALCAEYNDESSAEGDTAQETSTVLKVLREYLDDMAYAQDYHNEPLGMYGGASSAAAAGGAGGRGGAGKAEDEIARMKAEIRGFKGVLLSARNFPAGSAAGPVGGARRSMFPAVQAGAVVV